MPKKRARCRQSVVVNTSMSFRKVSRTESLSKSVIIKQVVVSSEHRKHVMSVSHEFIVGGHLAAKMTIDQITTSFHWPGITSDVTRF